MIGEPLSSLVRDVDQCNPRELGRPRIAYLDISSVDNGTKQLMYPQFIPVDAAPSRARQLVHANDVLVSTVRPNLNAVALVPVQFDREIASTGFCVLRSQPKQLWAEYLFYFTQSAAFVRHLTRIANGASYPAVTDNDILETSIPLPDLTEQHQIADRLEQADRLRRTRRYALELTDTFIPTTFCQFFGNVRVNTMQWDSVNLGELVIRGPQNGLYKPASAYGAGTPILRIDSFYDGAVRELDSLKRVRLTPEDIENFGLSENDIVVNRVNSRPYLGKSALIPKLHEPTVFESNMMRLTLNTKRANPVFVTHYLQTSFVKSQIQVLARDAVNQSSVNQEDVKGLIVRLPPIPLQKTFAALVERVHHFRAVQQEALRQAEHLFASLLDRAFGGQ